MFSKSEEIFLNTYAIALGVLAVFTMAVPLWLISPWFIPLQLLCAIPAGNQSLRLFSTLPEKKRMVRILVDRNKNEFHPASFEPYMKAPCGRLVVRLVLRRINRESEFKNLKRYKLSLKKTIVENCTTTETKITYGEDYR
jgi:hypothetical protein